MKILSGSAFWELLDWSKNRTWIKWIEGVKGIKIKIRINITKASDLKCLFGELKLLIKCLIGVLSKKL
jgi:hypothetical protein